MDGMHGSVPKARSPQYYTQVIVNYCNNSQPYGSKESQRVAKGKKSSVLTRSGAVEIIGSGTFEAHSRSCCAMFSAMNGEWRKRRKKYVGHEKLQ